MATINHLKVFQENSTIYPIQLNLEYREIRLLRIHNISPERLIYCSLVTVSLLNSPDYSALSYVWGDPAVTESIFDELPQADQNALLESAKRGLTQTQKIVHDLEAKGQIPLIKEHISSILDLFLTCQRTPSTTIYLPWKSILADHALNPTLIPDSYFLSFKPIFLIRHPGLAYPSLLGATRVMMPHIALENKSMEINMTMAWVRMVFAWFEQAAAAGQSHEPIVVDADDIMHDRVVVHMLVKILGGEPSELICSWDAVKGKDLENVQPYARTFESTLLASEGVVEGKTARNITVTVERGKWEEEFGMEITEKLEDFVEKAMDDYEFLKARRLRAA